MADFFQTTTATRRARSAWLALVIALSLLAIAHAWLVSTRLNIVSTTALARPANATSLGLVRPAYTADAGMWIRHALAVLEGEAGLRSHWTRVDNPPEGRPMHWNSGYLAWLAGCGKIWQRCTGAPLSTALEQAAIWANLPPFLAALWLLGIWTLRRWGAAAAAIVAVGMIGHRGIYAGFHPAYADHHGLIALSVLGLTLGLAFALGDGPNSDAERRRDARWAGWWGAFGLWVSAASLVPVIAATLAGLGLAIRCRRKSPAAPAADILRSWCRWGAAGSLVFYLAEYFPRQLGWRLEVNHPLYAAAWWGAGELAADWLDGARARGGKAWLARAGQVLAIVAAPALILVRGSEVFAPIDPLLVRLHATIEEFLPLMTRLRVDGWVAHGEFWVLRPAILLFAVATFVRVRPARAVLVLLLLPLVALTALGLMQVRWAELAAPHEVVLLAFAAMSIARGSRIRPAVAAAAVFALGAVLLFRFVEVAGMQGRLLAQRTVPADEGLQLVFRDAARAIRASQPIGPIVLFTNPNASVAVGYYGRFATLGTLYWENRAGLRRAAELNTAPSFEAARALIERDGVTHVMVTTQDNYVREFAELARPGITQGEFERTFAFRLLARREVPEWLEPVPYRTPRHLPGILAGLEVFIYRVNFQQTRAEAFERFGQFQLLHEDWAGARASFVAALDAEARRVVPHQRLAELELRAGRPSAAVTGWLAAAALSPPEVRYRLLTEAGIALEGARAPLEAATLYRRALEGPMTNAIALNNLAWLLAVSRDERLRAPAEALCFAQHAVEREPEQAGNRDTLAAALAANGDFAGAIREAELALRLAEQERDARLTELLRARLASYRRSQPWHE